MRHFSALLGAPSACADFRDPTEVSRFKEGDYCDKLVGAKTGRMLFGDDGRLSACPRIHLQMRTRGSCRQG